MTVYQSTIIYGKISSAIFDSVHTFTCTHSFLKNPEFAYRSLGPAIKKLVLRDNDYYGLMAFNMVYHVLYQVEKFKNIEYFEFEG